MLFLMIYYTLSNYYDNFEILKDKELKEGFRRFKPWDFTKNKYVIFLTLVDIGIIYFDFSYVFFFIPGIILALFGYNYLVGIFTLFTLPLNLISFTILLIHENNVAFKPLGLRIRKNIKIFLRICHINCYIYNCDFKWICFFKQFQFFKQKVIYYYIIFYLPNSSFS